MNLRARQEKHWHNSSWNLIFFHHYNYVTWSRYTRILMSFHPKTYETKWRTEKKTFHIICKKFINQNDIYNGEPVWQVNCWVEQGFLKKNASHIEKRKSGAPAPVVSLLLELNSRSRKFLKLRSWVAKLNNGYFDH